MPDFLKTNSWPVKTAKFLKSVKSVSVNMGCSLVKKTILYCIFKNLFEANREFTLSFPPRHCNAWSRSFYTNQLCLTQMMVHVHSTAIATISNAYFWHGNFLLDVYASMCFIVGEIQNISVKSSNCSSWRRKLSSKEEWSNWQVSFRVKPSLRNNNPESFHKQKKWALKDLSI